MEIKISNHLHKEKRIIILGFVNQEKGRDSIYLEINFNCFHYEMSGQQIIDFWQHFNIVEN